MDQGHLHQQSQLPPSVQKSQRHQTRLSQTRLAFHVVVVPVALLLLQLAISSVPPFPDIAMNKGINNNIYMTNSLLPICVQSFFHVTHLDLMQVRHLDGSFMTVSTLHQVK